MNNHLPPSAPLRTHYHFGTDIPIAEPAERHDEMSAYGDGDDFTDDIPRGWVILGLALLAWAMLIVGVYLAMGVMW